jgi:hypothetical protein
MAVWMPRCEGSGQRREVLAPMRVDAGRVGQELFEEGFDVVGVAAVKSRGGELLAARGAHVRKGLQMTLFQGRVV